MALRIKKDILEALAAVRNGERGVDLSQIVVPRLGGCIVKAADDGDSTVRRFKLSDRSRDRDRDTINPKGWDLKDFRVNGAILWAHNSWSPPIAEAGKTGVEGKGDDAALFGDARFIESYDFAKLLLTLIDEKALKNASVGFKPIEWVYNEDERGIDFQKQKLVEWSVVPIGSNINAMVQLGKTLDIVPLLDWATAWLDGEDKIADAVADEVEVAAIQKALSPFRASVDPGVAARAATATAKGDEPESTPESRSEKAGQVLSKKNKDKLRKASTLVAEVLAAAEKPEDEDEDDDKSATAVDKSTTPVLSLKGIDYLLGCVDSLELDDDRRKQLVDGLTIARAALDPESKEEFTEDTLRGMVREAMALKSGGGDETPITVEEVASLVRAELEELKKADIRRQTGRLPD